MDKALHNSITPVIVGTKQAYDHARVAINAAMNNQMPPDEAVTTINMPE